MQVLQVEIRRQKHVAGGTREVMRTVTKGKGGNDVSSRVDTWRLPSAFVYFKYLLGINMEFYI